MPGALFKATNYIMTINLKFDMKHFLFPIMTRLFSRFVFLPGCRPQRLGFWNKGWKFCPNTSHEPFGKQKWFKEINISFTCCVMWNWNWIDYFT